MTTTALPAAEGTGTAGTVTAEPRRRFRRSARVIVEDRIVMTIAGHLPEPAATDETVCVTNPVGGTEVYSYPADTVTALPPGAQVVTVDFAAQFRSQRGRWHPMPGPCQSLAVVGDDPAEACDWAARWLAAALRVKAAVRVTVQHRDSVAHAWVSAEPAAPTR